MVEQAQWFFSSDNRRLGPVSADELRRLIGEEGIEPTTLVWRKGMPDWAPASEHFSFDVPVRDGESPPPLPEDGVDAHDRGNASYGSTDNVRPTTGPDGLYVDAPSRSFPDAISACMGAYFVFAGRASRSEYWYFILFGVLVGLVTGFLDEALLGPRSTLINTLAGLVLILPSMAVTWRRLHDTGRSGWWIGGFWLGLAGVLALTLSGSGMPSAGMIMLVGLGLLVWTVLTLVFLCQRGDPGPNAYG